MRQSKLKASEAPQQKEKNCCLMHKQNDIQQNSKHSDKDLAGKSKTNETQQQQVQISFTTELIRRFCRYRCCNASFRSNEFYYQILAFSVIKEQ